MSNLDSLKTNIQKIKLVKKLIKYWGECRVDIHQYKSDKDTAYSFYDKQGVFNIVVNPTNKFREWMENLLFLFNSRKPWGFIAYSYRNVAEDFFPMMDKNYNGISPINFKGASRGGAVCHPLYCMFENKYKNNRRLHLYTFGCPPTGKDDAVAYYALIDMNHTRVVNKYDGVPSIPFYGKHYESELIELDNNRRAEMKWWRRPFTLTKEAHLGYGTDLQKLLMELENEK